MIFPIHGNKCLAFTLIYAYMYIWCPLITHLKQSSWTEKESTYKRQTVNLFAFMLGITFNTIHDDYTACILHQTCIMQSHINLFKPFHFEEKTYNLVSFVPSGTWTVYISNIIAIVIPSHAYHTTNTSTASGNLNQFFP